MADVVRLSFNSLRFSSSVLSSSSSSSSFNSLQQGLPPNHNSCKRISSTTTGIVARFASKPTKQFDSFKVHATVAETEQPKWWEKNAGPNMVDVHSTQEFLSALSQAGDKLVIVEFYGTWCASCRALFPKLCKTAAEHPEILFLKVNFDENKPMCKNLNVKVLPYFHFYRGADGQLDSFSCSLAKIHRQSSMSNVDNSPQSLLAFNGNQNVHGLYDFLLNYRFLLTSLTSMDVPVLYSPVPFQNAALSCPEVRCKEVRRADNISFPLKEFNMKDESSSSGFCYSIEIKDAYLPPWVIGSFCEAMCAEGMSFEASFVTESTTTGLNVGLETVCQKVNPHQPTAVEGLLESRSAFGISNTIFSLHLRSAFLKGLKYSNGSYTASVSSV